MDLITSISILDIVAGTSLAILLAPFLKMLWFTWSSNPLVQSAVNTTLVFLENTKEVWKPVVNATALVLKPIASFALAILKPLGPLALVVVQTIAKALAIALITTIDMVVSIYRIIHRYGGSITNATEAFFQATKDFAISLGTVLRGLTTMMVYAVHALSFAIRSVESVGSVVYRVLFQSHMLTLDDLYSISIPLLVIGSLVVYSMWKKSRKQMAIMKKNEDIQYPRRSSRLARKRAMLCSEDFSSALTLRKETPTTAPNL